MLRKSVVIALFFFIALKIQEQSSMIQYNLYSSKFVA